eukprot:53682_1
MTNRWYLSLLLILSIQYIHLITSQRTLGINELPPDPLIKKTQTDVDKLCDSYPSFSGWFRFLQNTAEAYFFVEDGFIYFEYYVPQYMFTAIAVSNQTNPDNTQCLDCYYPNKDVLPCLDKCVGGNEFVITGQADKTPDVLAQWHIWAVDFISSSAPIQPPIGWYDGSTQYVIERGRTIGTIIERDLELATVGGYAYIHGKWKRNWITGDDDEWLRQKSKKDPLCITTISSREGFTESEKNPPGYGAYMSGYTSLIYNNYTEIHCVNLTKQCTKYSDTPTLSPTNDPTILPTNEPTSSPTDAPTDIPTPTPTNNPTSTPTISPIPSPTISPTPLPTVT